MQGILVGTCLKESVREIELDPRRRVEVVGVIWIEDAAHRNIQHHEQLLATETSAVELIFDPLARQEWHILASRRTRWPTIPSRSTKAHLPIKIAKSEWAQHSSAMNGEDRGGTMQTSRKSAA